MIPPDEQSCIPSHLGSVDSSAQGSQDVGGVLAVVVTGGRVVAHGERYVGATGVAERVADNGGAANFLSALPDDLGEVAPSVEVGHVGAGGTVEFGEVHHLAVVHQVGDHLTDRGLLNTVSDVLTVATAVNGTRDEMSVLLNNWRKGYRDTHVSCW